MVKKLSEMNLLTVIPNAMKYIFLIGLITIVLVQCDKQGSFVDKRSNESIDSSDIQQIHKGVEKYVLAVNNADSAAASKLFARKPEVSFIHPRGRDTSWTQISTNIYKFFKDNFNTRDLKFYNEKISVYDQKTAWVEFNWIFNATLKGDTAAIQTAGRETQIWRKEDSEWLIVHVHYSSKP